LLPSWWLPQSHFFIIKYSFMKVATWKAVAVIAALVYGMFAIIHADAAHNAAWGNFLDVSGKIVLGLAILAGAYWFFSDKGTRTR
jgi:hypothetical protein